MEEYEITLDLLQCDAGWMVKYHNRIRKTNLVRLFKTEAEAEARFEEWRNLLDSLLTEVR